MHGTDRRDHEIGSSAVPGLQQRQPEIHVPVVAAGDDFIVGHEEHRPWPDLFADAIGVPDFGPHDLADRGRFQTDKPRRRVAGDQQKLHPERRMSEQGKKEVDHVQAPDAPAGAPGIVKVRTPDQLAAQRAAGGMSHSMTGIMNPNGGSSNGGDAIINTIRAPAKMQKPGMRPGFCKTVLPQ